MSFKKCFFALALLFVVSVFSFSQAIGYGVIGTYNPLNPSFWSAGYMFSATANYSGDSAHFIRMGMTAGQLTLTYEKRNPFTSTHEMTEYWQRSFYMDWIVGYAYQFNLIDILALRLGTDFYWTFSYAYIHSDFNKDMAFNVGLTGIAGLTLFPKGKFLLNLDACPGFTLNPAKQGADVFAFILPIRLTVGGIWGLL